MEGYLVKTIIYRKSDLERVGVIQPNSTLEWELENNVFPNFGGVETDYDYIETLIEGNIHLEKINGEVVAVPNAPTIEEQRHSIINQLEQLDKIVDRQSERIYEDTNTTPSYQKVIDTIAQKQVLRSQLSLLK